MKKITCIVLCLFVMGLPMIACDCNKPLREKMLKYYSDDSVYCNLCGEIKEKNDVYLIIEVFTESHTFISRGENGYITFVIYGSSCIEKIEVGDVIDFISAPMCFYNGHYMPIVYLEKEQEVLLSFEEGKTNYLNWINDTFK